MMNAGGLRMVDQLTVEQKSRISTASARGRLSREVSTAPSKLNRGGDAEGQSRPASPQAAAAGGGNPRQHESND